MKKHNRFVSVFLIPLLAVGVFLGLKNTKKIQKAKAMPITETVYWGRKGTTLYIAPNQTSNIQSCSSKGSFNSNYSDLLPTFDYDGATEMTIENKISLPIYRGFFSRFENLTKINNISNIDTSNATDFSFLFAKTTYTGETLDLSHFITSKVTNMTYMFSVFKYTGGTIDLSSFDTSKVTDMSYMFTGCECSEVNVQSFNTSRVTAYEQMFNSFTGNVDVSNFDINAGANLVKMFDGVNNVQTIRFRSINLTDCNITYMISWAKVGIIDLSNAIFTSGTLSDNAIEMSEVGTLYLPNTRNIGDFITCVKANNVVFSCKERPVLGDKSIGMMWYFSPKIIVPASNFEDFKNNEPLSDFSLDLLPAFFFSVNVTGYGSVDFVTFPPRYVLVAEIGAEPAGINIILIPHKHYELAADGISVVNSMNEPIAFNRNYYSYGYTELTFTMPHDDVTITLNFAPSFDAVAFAESFLDATGEVCALGSNDNLTALQEIWGDIVASYNTLSGADKDLLLEDNSDTRIIDTRERYSYIISKYNTETVKNLSEFIEGYVVTYNAPSPFIKAEDFDVTVVLLISIISAASLLTILLTTT